jgi:hypothetical protein
LYRFTKKFLSRGCFTSGNSTRIISGFSSLQGVETKGCTGVVPAGGTCDAVVGISVGEPESVSRDLVMHPDTVTRRISRKMTRIFFHIASGINAER